MNELTEMLNKQSELIERLSSSLTTVTGIVNQLAERVIQLETDMQNVLENTKSIRGGKYDFNRSNE